MKISAQAFGTTFLFAQVVSPMLFFFNDCSEQMWVAWNMCPNCWMSLHAYDDTNRMMIYGYAQRFEPWGFFVEMMERQKVKEWKWTMLLKVLKIFVSSCLSVNALRHDLVL